MSKNKVFYNNFVTKSYLKLDNISINISIEVSKLVCKIILQINYKVVMAIVSISTVN